MQSMSAADIDGDGLVEVAIGLMAKDVQFDAKYASDYAARVNSANAGGVLLFTLGSSKAMQPTSEQSIAIENIRQEAGASRADRALVVPGSVRFIQTPLNMSMNA